MTRIKSILSKIIIYGLLISLLFLTIVPFYMVMVNATHTSFNIVTRLNLLPGGALLDNYETMQTHVNIWRGFANSLLISLPYTVLTGYFGALVGFGFAKYSFKGKRILYSIVLASMMIPSQVSIIGFYQLNLRLHLLNTYYPFILPGIANASAVFFLRGIIAQSIPDSMIEAARIDGCSEFMIFNRVVFPCVIPGVVAICIFNFVSSWNNYIGPLIVMSDSDMYTMPVMISMIKGLYLTNYGAMYLAITISVVPTIIVFCLLSKYIVNGLTAGANK
ncbi:carbohydrate ABC transporter permease [Lachnoclostridium sp. Marseille-P6806]|uniref:carbohydrate ABC transporter permease n=1 Tax=Lachnoclostridium sp. Marseille-P6806 TaxID=2364793 RepID=UPI001031315C|nr:carbohydrate ABC transporter permease [Lachnoclostridium sp. Marseille-P6806]